MSVTDNRPIGIMVAATGIPKEVYNRFEKTLNITTPENFVLNIVTKTEDFTRSKCRNQGILAMLDKCEVIVCVDVDMLVPPGLVKHTIENVKDGTAVWAKCRNLNLVQQDDFHWKEWMKLPVRHGAGSWVAMTVADWLRTGGWDERITSWGGEDDVLRARRKDKGIETKVTDDFPLMHVNHSVRGSRSLTVGMANLNLGRTRPPKNFLTARLPILSPANNHFNIFVTAACTRHCPNCSQRGFTNQNSGYNLSLADLGAWIACTKASGYPPYHSVILTGGEPLLWDNLEEGTRLLCQAKVGRQLNLFSNGDKLEHVTDKLMESLTMLRLSHYGNNDKSIKSLKKRYGNKVVIVDRQRHFPIPTKLAGNEILPAKCSCGGPALLGQQVYGCAMLVTVANELGIDLSKYPESQCKLQVGYLELLAGFPRLNHDCCRGCIGNLLLRKGSVCST